MNWLVSIHHIPLIRCQLCNELNVQGVALCQSRGLFENISDYSSCNFLLLWLHTSCSMANRPGELEHKLSCKPNDRASATLCTVAGFYFLACEVWILDEICLPVVSHGLLRPCPR